MKKQILILLALFTPFLALDAYYLTNHIGIFGEYSYGIPTVLSWSLRGGVSVKF